MVYVSGRPQLSLLFLMVLDVEPIIRVLLLSYPYPRPSPWDSRQVLELTTGPMLANVPGPTGWIRKAKPHRMWVPVPPTVLAFRYNQACSLYPECWRACGQLFPQQIYT